MKDLKHLYYFEKLLEDANNELVREAQSQGKKCVGSVCYQIPEVLLNLDGLFSVRLRAPRTGSMEMGTYYMTSFLCEYTRALLERAIEGGYQFLDCLIAPDGCTMINRCVENMELLKVNEKPDFFYEYLEVPMKADENGLNLYVSECRKKILNAFHDRFGTDVSDQALSNAIERHNRLCKVISALGEFRKEEYPRITGYEFHVLCLSTYVCPHDLILEKLEETLEEVKRREPDTPKEFHKKYRTRVELVGSEVDDPDLVRLIEESGALVVADRFCFGSLPGREEILLQEGEDPLTAICRHHLMNCMCPRHMNMEKFNARKTYIDKLAKDYHADGIIIEQMKFCDPWSYERTTATHMLRDDYHYPVLSIDRPYAVGTSGQLRTRVQAFVESVEIKKIHKGDAK